MDVKSVWEGFKRFAYTWVGGLIMREKANGQLAVSLSRTTFAGIVVYLFTFWNAWKPAKVDMGAIGETLKGLDFTKVADPAQLQGLVAEAVSAAVATLPPPESLPPGLMEVFYTVAGIAFGTQISDAIKNRGAGGPPV